VITRSVSARRPRLQSCAEHNSLMRKLLGEAQSYLKKRLKIELAIEPKGRELKSKSSHGERSAGFRYDHRPRKRTAAYPKRKRHNSGRSWRRHRACRPATRCGPKIAPLARPHRNILKCDPPRLAFAAPNETSSQHHIPPTVVY
jgi:hypothetical protein